MKSLVFKSAWSIFKIQKISFSDALKLAWKSVKEGVKAVIVRSNRLVKSKGLGYETIYFDELVFTNIEVKRGCYRNDSISAWYDGNTFNND